NKNLTLDGSGQNVTLDGQNSVGVLEVYPNVNFTLNALTIANGAASNSNDDLGGGIIYAGGGTVTISNSTFANDSASNGGAIYNNGSTVNISNSTFTNDSAPNVYGGGALDNVG